MLGNTIFASENKNLAISGPTTGQMPSWCPAPTQGRIRVLQMRTAGLLGKPVETVRDCSRIGVFCDALGDLIAVLNEGNGGSC